jgi:hypothetical protein
MALITSSSTMARRARRIARASLRTVCLYGLAGAGYSAFVAIFRPDALGQRVWHSSSWPHRDTFGAIAFLASFVACLLLQLSGDGLVKL